MNIIAVAETGFAFYKKHAADIAKLIPKGSGDPTFRSDAVAFIKKHYPQYNPNGLIDDTLALIDLVMAPDAPYTAGDGATKSGG